MTAIVAEGEHGRLFLSPTDNQTTAARTTPEWRPAGRLPEKALGISIQGYGFAEWNQLFTERQLLTQTTLSDLLADVRSAAINDGADAECADAIATYLALGIEKNADSGNRFARWQNAGDFVAGVFGMQTINIIWDFVETNPFSSSTQNWIAQIEWIAKVVERLVDGITKGTAYQADASTTEYTNPGPVIVTDPPYYASVGYADLSDFFYTWLRPLLRDIYPDLFAGIGRLRKKARRTDAGGWSVK